MKKLKSSEKKKKINNNFRHKIEFPNNNNNDVTPKKKNKDKKKINFSPLNQFALKNQQKIISNKDNNSNYNNIIINENIYDNNNNNTDFKKKRNFKRSKTTLILSKNEDENPSNSLSDNESNDISFSKNRPKTPLKSFHSQRSMIFPNKNKNVHVYVRFRPLNDFENDLLLQNIGWLTPLFVSDEIIQLETHKNNQNYSNQFVFDKVFNTDANQDFIYNIVGKEIVNDVMSGYNGTIFAYGQSGSGKTYTMYGPDFYDKNKGIIPRIISDIFNYVENSEEHINFQFKLSICQIYKEIIYDLINLNNSNLKIKESPTKGIFVEKLSEIYISNLDEFMNYIEIAQNNRKTSETKLNHNSSRSHSILILEITQHNLLENIIKRGILNLVDLAGSEKVSKTGAIGETLEEAKKINLSLSALGNVIHALTSNKKNEHIPYRDSKLTRILQESLGGNFKTSLVVTCSPHSYHLEETLSSLYFGKRVKTIKNYVKVNIKYTYDELQKMVYELEEKLKKNNVDVGDNNNNNNSDEKMKEIVDKYEKEKKNFEEEINELKDDLKNKENEINELKLKENELDKNKLIELYKKIINELNEVRKKNEIIDKNNFFNINQLKNNLNNNSKIFNDFVNNLSKEKEKNFDEINKIIKNSLFISNEEKYNKIYNNFTENLKNFSNEKNFKFSDPFFSLNFIKYYYSNQILIQNFIKTNNDLNNLFKMNKILINIIEEILNSNYEMANNDYYNNNNNNLNPFKITFGERKVVKVINKRNVNLMKTFGRNSLTFFNNQNLSNLEKINEDENRKKSIQNNNINFNYLNENTEENNNNLNKNLALKIENIQNQISSLKEHLIFNLNLYENQKKYLDDLNKDFKNNIKSTKDYFDNLINKLNKEKIEKNNNNLTFKNLEQTLLLNDEKIEENDKNIKLKSKNNRYLNLEEKNNDFFATIKNNNNNKLFNSSKKFSNDDLIINKFESTLEKNKSSENLFKKTLKEINVQNIQFTTHKRTNSNSKIYETNNNYFNNNNNNNKIFNIEDYIKNYLETGTASRRFDGIKVDMENGKVKCDFDSGLSANKVQEINPLYNAKLNPVNGDDDDNLDID